jgi:hypothetical protein
MGPNAALKGPLFHGGRESPYLGLLEWGWCMGLVEEPAFRPASVNEMEQGFSP